jgi:hypothetical protein
MARFLQFIDVPLHHVLHQSLGSLMTEIGSDFLKPLFDLRGEVHSMLPHQGKTRYQAMTGL